MVNSPANCQQITVIMVNIIWSISLKALEPEHASKKIPLCPQTSLIQVYTNLKIENAILHLTTELDAQPDIFTGQRFCATNLQYFMIQQVPKDVTNDKIKMLPINSRNHVEKIFQCIIFLPDVK